MVHKDMVVFDTVYAPRTTKLMKVAQKAGVKHVFDGIGIMIEQGAASFKLWTGKICQLITFVRLCFQIKKRTNNY